MPPYIVALQEYGIWQKKSLPVVLGARVKIDLGLFSEPSSVRLGWGRKASGLRASRLAARSGAKACLLEDGFLRSLGIGNSDEPLSLVLDDLGIYYDASRASRLERLIAEDIDSSAVARATDLRRAWCAGKLSKYNYARSYLTQLPENYVLVVDQTFGDASISYGLASADSFDRMLKCALSENPSAQIVLKVHPEVLLGRKRGHFDLAALASEARITVLGTDVHPAGVLAGADMVYVVTSQMGFEGLLWGCRVRTFGMPFYAGWGLTEDELPAPERRRQVPLDNLVYAALVSYPRYIDPETGECCEPERVIEWMGLQRRMRERFPERLFAVGFPAWKKPIIREFFQGSSVGFVNRPEQLMEGSSVIVWGMKSVDFRPRWFERRAKRGGIRQLDSREIVRVEDGFLRSVGLGAELVRPLSWVIDRTGIYYDSTQPSDLEQIFQNYFFDETLLARAAALRERIVLSGLTKYNVGQNSWRRPAGASRVILVPGQVESDASIAYGAPESVCRVRRNMDLLRTVRAANPQAYIVFKPHPDVLAGLRLQGRDEGSALQWCDEQVVDISMAEMLAQVDEVHVITSLAGFEALLRGKMVTCYGQPFYAGWGLTTDMVPVPRRTRQLSLDAMVAGALILYPTYVSRTTGRFTTPERALDELLTWREQGGDCLPWWRRMLRLFLRLFYRW